MALQRLNGDLSYNDLMLALGTSLTSLTAINTLNTTKVHFVGRFWHKDRSSKSIARIWVRVGAMTLNAASVVQVSIQKLDFVNGPPGRGDGTVVVSGTGAGSTFSANSLSYVNLSTNYTAAPGDQFVVVIQLTTFNTGDSLILQTVSNLSSLECFPTFESATPTFTVSNTSPIVIFECTDGTVGTFNRTCPILAPGSQNINLNSTPDEVGMEFSMPVACTLSGARMMLGVLASADFDVLLYQGTTLLATVSPTLDYNTVNAASTNRIYNVQFPETNLTANTLYTISVLPPGTSNMTVYYADIGNTYFWQAHQAELSWAYKTRTNAGSWTTVSSRRPWWALLFSKIDDGVQTGGGGGGTGISRSRTQGGN